jgi:hypothetical protein
MPKRLRNLHCHQNQKHKEQRQKKKLRLFQFWRSQDHLSEYILAFFLTIIRCGQKEHANCIFPWWWQFEPYILSNLNKPNWSKISTVI